MVNRALATSILLLCTVAACDTGSSGGGPHRTVVPVSLDDGDPGRVLAKVGSSVITVEELEYEINKQSPFVRARYLDPKAKREFLDNEVRFEALAQEAVRRGLHDDPEVQAAIRKVLVQKLMRDEFDAGVTLADITDAEVQAYYDANRDDYHKPAQVRLSHIQVDSKAEAEALLAQLRKEKADRGLLRKLVQSRSKDEKTRDKGGDLGFLTRAQLEERFGLELAETAFTLAETGAYGPVTRSKMGWHVVRLTGKRREVSRSVGEVRNQIKNRLYRKKRKDAFDVYLAQVKQRLGVQVFPERLSEVKVNPDANVDGASPIEHAHRAKDVAPPPAPAEAKGDKP